MKHKRYNYFYAANMVIIIVILFIVSSMNDMWQMLLGGYAIILTSIFTYSNRHDLSRKERSKNDK